MWIRNFVEVVHNLAVFVNVIAVFVVGQSDGTSVLSHNVHYGYINWDGEHRAAVFEHATCIDRLAIGVQRPTNILVLG